MRSVMPSGSSKTGLKIPKTAGSIRVGDDIVFTRESVTGSSSRLIGVAAFNTAFSRNQERSQIKTLTAKPNNQTDSNTTEPEFVVGAAGYGEDATSTTRIGSKSMPIGVTVEIGHGGAMGVRHSN